jgi:signal transduction histidine kinase
MTGTIMGLDMVEVLMDEDLPKAKGMIEHLKDNARDNLVQVRQVVNTLDPNQNVSKGLDSINGLIDSYSFKSNVDINFKVKGNIIKLNPAINIVLYRTIQEGLTNAIRHSECSKIDINLEFYNTHIDLKIKDDGIGSNNTGQGYGLQSMEDRVLSIGGNILFLPDEGFEILINIPLEVSND